MEYGKEFNLTVNSSKMYLSSETKVFKTERFLFATKKIAGVDKFILEISEEVQTIAKTLISQLSSTKSSDCLSEVFKVETFDKRFSFLFALGKQLSGSKVLDKNNLEYERLDSEGLEELDIVFFEDISGHDVIRSNDQCINIFLKKSNVFSVVVSKVKQLVSMSDFKKLYHVSDSDFVNMPLLFGKQKELVEIENKNVLIQGVAGSGKTNICISKIIFAASRNYSGKVLYTTFSRGLLIDTKNKVELFKNNIKSFIESYEQGKIVFLDNNHKKAIENRLGLCFGEDTDIKILDKLKQIVLFLETHVDYKLIEDFYLPYNQEINVATEKTFTENFLKTLGNHQLKSKLSSLKNLSYQIIYKEIFGMIFGNLTESELGNKRLNNNDNKSINNLSQGNMLSLEEYRQKREGSFDKLECELIYGLAKEYARFKKSQNYVDNNDISRILLENPQKMPKYSLSILDEVQDFTQINLKLFETMSLKLLAVGDALQMINPSYFNFSFLKNLMYKEDITDVAELEYNFRNNKAIANLLNKLGELNIKEFGTHNFVNSTKSVDQTAETSIVYTNDKQLLNKLQNQKFENFTILASDYTQKKELQKLFKRQEVLSISEIKGLERDSVLMINVLSDNIAKWQTLSRIKVNRKQSDENSVYRYYFNLFYVGLSRAKHNIFVFEKESIANFEDFFKDNFECMDGTSAFEKFSKVISRIEIDDDEIVSRVEEFIKLGQFDNARFYADKFEDAILAEKMLAKIDAFDQFVFKGKNREAGIRLWKAGLVAEAKEQFEISGDTALIEFLDNLESRDMQNLDVGIIKFFTEFNDNKQARELIIDVINQDLKQIKEKHQEIKEKLKFFKEKKHG